MPPAGIPLIRRAIRSVVAPVLAAGFLALPSSSLAATTVFVDNGGSNTANTCHTATNPCQTIAQALTFTNPGDTVKIGGGTYNENISLQNNVSLLGANFDPPLTAGTPILTSSSGTTVVVLPGSNGSHVENLTIRGTGGAVSMNASATITGNTFDGNAAAARDLVVAAGSPTISGNTFTDPTATDVQTGIFTATASGSPVISGNKLTGFDAGIEVDDSTGTAQVTNNEIAGTHSSSSGYGIHVKDALATVSRNSIHDPVGSTLGILVSESTPGSPGSGATLSRNRVIGTGLSTSAQGVVIFNTPNAVTLNSDLITGWGRGLVAIAQPPSSAGAATATNETVFGNGLGDNDPTTTDVTSDGTHLTLDSTIVAQNPSAPNGGTCTITNSRGPVATPGGNGCQNFQTTADPMFLNEGAGDYHLKPGSPMIDAGSSAAPAAGSKDIDGNPRALAGHCGGGARRDIGADELVPDCDPPETTFRKKPPRQTTDRTPTFKFVSDEPGSKFRCQLDGGRFKHCTSPKTLGTLAFGAHVFRVKAIDPSGNADPTPARRAFTVIH